jgi:DNA-binding NarL/FixJ family response regulator
MRPLRLLVVDDHELYRSGLRMLLADEGYKVNEAPSGEVAIRLARSFAPDVVVMDMNMPGISGIEAARIVSTEHPRTAVLMLTVNDDDSRVLDAVRAGASGYLLKDAPMREIVAGIEAAAAGHSPLSPRVASIVMTRLRTAPTPQIAGAQQLSEREQTVLALVAKGYENAEIARELYLSLSTVRNLVSRVLGKLGVENRVQAATYAVCHGLADVAVGS